MPIYNDIPESVIAGKSHRNNLDEDFSCAIYCIGYHDNDHWKETEISADFGVYPCCILHGKHQLEKKFDDKYLDNLDENWNKLTHNTLENILKIWHEYIKPEKWYNEDTMPECCGKKCRIRK